MTAAPSSALPVLSPAAWPPPPPGPVTSSTSRLRLAPPVVRAPAADDHAVPMAAYLVLLPADADPATFFAHTGLRPHIRPVPLAGADPASPVTDRPDVPDGPVRIDPGRHVAEVEGAELDLTYLEFALLARLVERPGQVHSREQLVRSVWGQEHVGDGRTVDVHVARLRRKLGPAHRDRIVTVHRVGYKYVPDA